VDDKFCLNTSWKMQPVVNVHDLIFDITVDGFLIMRTATQQFSLLNTMTMIKMSYTFAKCLPLFDLSVIALRFSFFYSTMKIFFPLQRQ